MTGPRPLPGFLYEIVSQLRRHGLPLGVDDCNAIRQALAAGFGWASSRALQELCVALWAKSPDEADAVRAVFSRVAPPEWDCADAVSDAGQPAVEDRPPAAQAGNGAGGGPERDAGIQLASMPGPTTGAAGGGLPPWPLLHWDPSLVFLPHYPVTDREVAQIWRRLRRPRRYGPSTELDTAATLDRYCQTGVVTPPVLVPRRRNTASLVLLLDRQGSMTPFHNFVDHILAAIKRSGWLDSLTVAYFRNTVGRSGGYNLLSRLPDPFGSAIDPVIHLVPPLARGRVYDDADLSVPIEFNDLRAKVTPTTGVVVVSDAGAARGALNTTRVLDAVAMLKSLRATAAVVAWLNPLPPTRWENSTAEQVARHVPMFALTREGMHHTVDVLRGHPTTVEQPL